jgi:hypothetical protein
VERGLGPAGVSKMAIVGRRPCQLGQLVTPGEACVPDD